MEDDTVLADGLTHVLGQSGYSVTGATSGAYAESALLTQSFDLVILDLGLPDIEGCELLRRLRARKNPVPVLVLTARDALDDRVKGLQWGADDYMIKPFDLRELEARIHALIRRRYGGFGDLKVGRLMLDALNRQVLVDDVPIILSAREYGVLETLLIHAGRVVSKDRIAQRLSAGNEELGDNAIEVYIHRLRKRMEAFGVKIRTVRGLGYLLEKDADG